MERIDEINEELKQSRSNYKNLSNALEMIPKDDTDRKKIGIDKLRIACEIERLEFELSQRKNEQLINKNYDYQVR